jgi:hypothetical protein
MESECIETLTNHKFSILLWYDGHGTIMFNDANNTWHTHETYLKIVLKLLQ